MTSVLVALDREPIPDPFTVSVKCKKPHVQSILVKGKGVTKKVGIGR